MGIANPDFEQSVNKTIPAVIALAAFVLAGLAACHSFSTVQGNINSNRMTGLIYYLPKGRIRITGDFKDGGGAGAPASSKKKTFARSDAPDDGDTPEPKNFVVTIAADIEADPTARYLLTPDRNYLYNDEINIGVNGKQLLSTGEATAEDQTAQIISTIAQVAAQIPFVAKEAVNVPNLEEPPETVNKLLLTVQSAIKARIVSLDTTLPSAALFGLPGAAGGFSRERENEGKRYVDELSQRNFVSLRSILRLLHMFPPEQRIDWTKAPQLWGQLKIILTAKPAPPKPPVKPRPFNIIIDPEYKKSVDVTDMEGNIFLKICITEELQPNLQLKTIWEAQRQDRRLAHGIIFRPLRAYHVTVKSIGTYFEIDEHREILLPDCREEHELLLDYSRLAFVKKTTKIAFVDGTPQKLGQTVPSPVLGFLAIPKGIIQAMVPLASSITGTPVGVQAPGTTGTANSPASTAQPAASP
jgi:hypothetical protein